MRKKKVLFLCTGNSCRSQMAESILRESGSDRFDSNSAGSQPNKEKFPSTAGVHPMALSTLKANNCPVDNLSSKSWDTFIHDQDSIDFVITLCGDAHSEMSDEGCPFFPGKSIRAHWGLDDPDKAKGNDEEIKQVFQNAFEIIKKRVVAFLALDMDTLSEQEIMSEVNKIGNIS